MNTLKKHFEINTDSCISNSKYVFKGNNYRITFLSDVLIRFEYNESGIFNDYPTFLVKNRNFDAPNINIKEDQKYIIAENQYFRLEYTKGKNFYGSKVMPDSNLRVTLSNTDKIWYFGHPEARNLMGSAYSLDDSKGKAALKKGLFSFDGFFSIDDSNSLIFEKDGSIHNNPSKGIDKYLFIYKKDYGRALKSYFNLTGMPPMIPRYMLGTIWNKNEVYNESDIINLVNKFKKNEIPFSTILLGKSWHGINDDTPNSGFTFNTKLISDPVKLISFLRSSNIYLGLNINTIEGISKNEINYNKMKQVLNIKEDITIPFNVYNINYVNAFLDYILNPLENIGVDFFWIDDNNKDLNRLQAINHYIYTDYKKNMSKRGIVLSRNPGIASHNYPIHYSGNTIVSWKTLSMLPSFNSLSSNIGISWWSHDIGGFKGGIEDSELYMRYVQFGVYSPILRLSSEKGKYYKREPWNWDVKTFKVVKDYLIIRHKLIPYIYSEAYKYHKNGSPLIQPLYYRFPELIDEPSYMGEYFFGSELLVSPITNPKDSLMNRVVHKIFLPNGSWYDFKTGKKFPGGKRYVTFYKDEDYPVFVKSGGIVVLGGINEKNINSLSAPENMEIHIFPGRNNSYEIYEDDGVSRTYETKNYLITDIDYEISDDANTIKLTPVSGQKGIVPIYRNYKFKFRNIRVPDRLSVIVDGNVVPFKSHKDDNDYVIELNHISSLSKITIKCYGSSLEVEALRLINEDLDSIISDLMIETNLKEIIAGILFSDSAIKRKRIDIKKLKSKGLSTLFIKMFLRLLEYIADV